MKNDSNNPEQQGKKAPKKPSKLRFLNTISTAILILFLITGFYSILVDQTVEQNLIPLSELVHDVGMGKVTAITVQGNTLIAEYQDKTTKTSKKETDASVTETFTSYGLTPEKLNAVKISIEGPSGFWFWVGQRIPANQINLLLVVDLGNRADGVASLDCVVARLARVLSARGRFDFSRRCRRWGRHCNRCGHRRLTPRGRAAVLDGRPVQRDTAASQHAGDDEGKGETGSAT
jgi:hypothetical protein